MNNPQPQFVTEQKVFILWMARAGRPPVMQYVCGNYRTAWNAMCLKVGKNNINRDTRGMQVMLGHGEFDTTWSVTEHPIWLDDPPEEKPVESQMSGAD